MYDLDSLSLESVIVKRESDDEFSRFVPYLAPNFKELVKNVDLARHSLGGNCIL